MDLWPECVHTIMNIGWHKIMEISWLAEEMLAYKKWMS